MVWLLSVWCWGIKQRCRMGHVCTTPMQQGLCVGLVYFSSTVQKLGLSLHDSFSHLWPGVGGKRPGRHRDPAFSFPKAAFLTEEHPLLMGEALDAACMESMHGYGRRQSFPRAASDMWHVRACLAQLMLCRGGAAFSLPEHVALCSLQRADRLEVFCMSKPCPDTHFVERMRFMASMLLLCDLCDPVFCTSLQSLGWASSASLLLC